MDARGTAVPGGVSRAPETRFLTLAARAYARCDDELGAVLFDRAHDEVMPLVRRVVVEMLNRHGRESDIDDAIQATMISIWQSVTKGVEPEIRRHAALRAIDVLRRGGRHEHLQLVDEYEMPEEPHHGRARQLFAQEDHADGVEARIDAAQRVRDAAAVRPVWGQIAAVAAIEGHETAKDIAAVLNRPAGTIRRNVMEMRLAGLHLVDEAAA